MAQLDALGYLRQALEHIAAAQDAGMRIKGVTLWTGIDHCIL